MFNLGYKVVFFTLKRDNFICTQFYIWVASSAVEHPAFNRLVLSSNLRRPTFQKSSLFKTKKYLNDLIFKAQTVHKKSFPKLDIQLASLLSIKTGSCPEDCKYCPQSAHYNVDLKKEIKRLDFKN